MKNFTISKNNLLVYVRPPFKLCGFVVLILEVCLFACWVFFGGVFCFVFLKTNPSFSIPEAYSGVSGWQFSNTATEYKALC